MATHQPTFRFIGVTTGQSSALKMWPAWMDILGRPEVVIEGVDLPLHAPPAQYRAVVAEIKRAPHLVGALVTTHKLDLLAASRDLFDELGYFAALCAEVSSISKDGDRLLGHATDPIAGGRSVQALLGDGYFGRSGGHVLCLGAGGAGTALSLHLATTPLPADRPQRIVLVDVDEARLTKAQHLLDGLDTDVHFEYLLSDDPTVNDRRMAALPEASLVINATGMGKDRPGAPVTGAGLFRAAASPGISTTGRLPTFYSTRPTGDAPSHRRRRLDLLHPRLGRRHRARAARDHRRAHAGRVESRRSRRGLRFGDKEIKRLGD
ncbi:MAG: shikimate dehydrogenase [Caldilineaceae bacterium]